MARRKGPRRPRYSPEAPLELPARVPGTEALAHGLAGPARLLLAVVSRWPAHDHTRAGRDRARLLRGAVVVAGLAVIAAAGRAWWGLAGAGLIALSLVLPLGPVRKKRWEQALRRHAGPRERAVAVPAEVRYDGTRLVVRAGGRVFRSLRPASPPHDVHLGTEGDHALLGLTRPGGRKRESLWFRAPADAVPAGDPARAPLPDPARVADPVDLDPEGWSRLREAVAPPAA